MEVLIIILLSVLVILPCKETHNKLRQNDKWYIMENYLSECSKIRYRENYNSNNEENQNQRRMGKYT